MVPMYGNGVLVTKYNAFPHIASELFTQSLAVYLYKQSSLFQWQKHSECMMSSIVFKDKKKVRKPVWYGVNCGRSHNFGPSTLYIGILYFVLPTKFRKS